MKLTLVPVESNTLHHGVTLDVAPHLTLADVIALGRATDPDAFSFHERGEAPDWWSPVLIRQSAMVPLEKGPEFEPVPVVIDSDGRATWHQDASAVSIADLQRTVDLGVMDARSDILGYELLELGGNGEVHALLDLWQTFLPWIHDVAGAAVGLALGGLYSVLSKHWRGWRTRKCRPVDVINLSQARQWPPRSLAKILAIGQRDAEVLIQFIGVPPSGSPELLRLLFANRDMNWVDAFPPECVDRVVTAAPELQSELDEWRSWGTRPADLTEQPTEEVKDVPRREPEDPAIALLSVTDAHEVGAELKRLRLVAGLTQRQFAEVVQVTPQQVSRIERGVWGPRSLGTIAVMADALGFRAAISLWPKDIIEKANRALQKP